MEVQGRKIKATDMTLWKSDGATPTPNILMVACLTQVAVNMARAEIQSKTFCGTTSDPDDVTIEVPFQGEVVLGTDADTISSTELAQLMLSGERAEWIIQPLLPVAGDIISKFTGWLSQNDKSGQVGNNVTFTCNLKVDVPSYSETAFVAP